MSEFREVRVLPRPLVPALELSDLSSEERAKLRDHCHNVVAFFGFGDAEEAERVLSIRRPSTAAADEQLDELSVDLWVEAAQRMYDDHSRGTPVTSLSERDAALQEILPEGARHLVDYVTQHAHAA